MIQIKNVHKVYKTKSGKVHAVNDVSLSIETGEIYGIIGYSGAGKSTMIRLLNGLEQPTEGTVTINSQEISSAKGKKLRDARQKISMIFQHFNLLWSRTVSENIEFPLEIAGVPKEQRAKRVLELVELVGLAGREDAYPSQLSGGQKQRVGIARALANNPEVLLCDEATSALDPETTDAILELLLDINKRLGLTIVLITHEMHVIQSICDRVAVMENGEVIESGDVFDVFTDPQHLTSQRFIRSVQQDLPSPQILEDWRSRGGNGFYRVIFKGDVTNKAILSQVTQKHRIHFNIVYGSIRELQERLFGDLIVSFEGDTVAIQSAINELETIVDIQEVAKHEG